MYKFKIFYLFSFTLLRVIIMGQNYVEVIKILFDSRYNFKRHLNNLSYLFFFFVFF